MHCCDLVSPVTAGGFPFAGRLIEHRHGELLVELDLDLEKDLFLADHVLIQAPEDRPLAARWPVLPFTFSLEIAAEVSAHLVNGRGLLGFERASARRWIALRNVERSTLRVEARASPAERDRTLRVEVAITQDHNDSPSFTVDVLYGLDYRVDLDLLFTKPTQVARSPFSLDQIYGERLLFHGPSLQCVCASPSFQEVGLEGRLMVRRGDQLFAGTSDPRLLIDPCVLDGVGQLIGLWGLPRDLYLFPIGIGKVELYRSSPAPGTVVPVRAEVTGIDDRTLTADIEIGDGAGHVWMRIRDWKDWIFRWPRRLFDFRRRPTEALLSRGAATAPEPASHCVRWIDRDKLPMGELEMVAQLVLHCSETSDWLRQTGSPAKVRQKWLLSRIVAKDAIRELRRNESSGLEHPARILLRREADGTFVDRSASPTLRVAVADNDRVTVAVAADEAAALDLVMVAERQLQAILEIELRDPM